MGSRSGWLAAGALAVGVVLVSGVCCSSDSEPRSDQFSGGGIDLSCDSASGVRFDVAADAIGAASPDAALEGIRTLLESAGSDITLPDGKFVGAGIASGNTAKVTLVVDGDTAATVDLVNPGRGWVINGVTACS